jgi:hypothetical protein
VFYSYVNTDGQGIKIWTPPGKDPIRGVILFGNPGGGMGGDTRKKSRQQDIVEFAARYHFGAGGVTYFPGSRTYESLGVKIIDAFREWGRLGVHPELESVPFIFSGSSNAGIFSFAMMMLVPDRTICITPNVGPYYKGKIDNAVRKVPAWLHIGTTDPLFAGGFKDTETLFAEHAPLGALWTWEAEIKGHQTVSSDHIDAAFWDTCLKMRLPDTVNPNRTAPVKLKDIDQSLGWYTDFRTWDYPIAEVFPAKAGKPFPEDKSRYGWVPSEAIARLYQSAASRVRQMNISFAENRKTAGGVSTGIYLSSSGSYLADPGDSVTIKTSLAPLQKPFDVIEFFDRAEKIGEIDANKTLDFTFIVKDRPVYAIYARAKHKGFLGENYERISNPLQIVVRQNKLSTEIVTQLSEVDWYNSHKKKAEDPAKLDRLKGDKKPGDSGVIHAVPLNKTQAAIIQTNSGSVWQSINQRASPVLIDQTCEVAGRAGDTTVKARAAYSSLGLYLIFEVKDVLPSESKDSRSGQIDFHIASIGLPGIISSKGSLDVFAAPALNSLLRNALQISFDVSPDGLKDISVNYWDPWDIVTTKISADQFKDSGLKLDIFKTGSDVLIAELFLPWAIAGNPGLKTAPPAGTSLAVEIGYNSANKSNKYRWPYGKDPWSISPIKNPEAHVFGEIILDEGQPPNYK